MSEMGYPPKSRPADEHDQPKPTINDHPVIQTLVMDDMRQRLQVGIERYGTGLQPFNGRDMLRDLYEELLDAAVYVRGAIYERDDLVELLEEAAEAVGSPEWQPEDRETSRRLLEVAATLRGLRRPT
jgi:hypothetical protein